ncbi:LMBR1 domain-containing protein 2 homolog A-like isoform X3 [Durio zibethinus]|uniref:LMBR1 domain-containing protein 2 homolog A-like isoform X3 n=1 Tax=Durio zibethinus TaxID=66656 RepID=A0A6P5YG10_DURZI|nr:LMBR1 domain-containing protein 2 homolog A-like isoform X3 [Durio zibethinus]
MWVFYLISLPLTIGMVIFTLRYFAGPDVPRYVLFTVGYAWFCSLSIIILVPADIWTTISKPENANENGQISFFWSWSYWGTFLLTWSGDILGLAMALSNTFGLVTGAFLLGFGLSEIPKSLWRNADWTIRQKVLSHKIAKMAVKLDEAHQEFSNAIVVAQATSNQMSKRDPLRPYMDVIDNMLAQMFREDPSFKPQGGRLGENDMDYDSDEKSMATLRRHLRIAREEYYRYKSEYMTYISEALQLEDTIKNYGRRSSTGWKYVSSFRPGRSGKTGTLLDTIEFIWRCIIRKQLEKVLAILLGIMSAAILLAEATLLPRGVDLSLFSILINSVKKQEVLVQVFAFVPLMYMCICTYYSLFKVGMLMFYSLTPRQTSSVSLLMICSMVARYAPPISYNFLNLISLGGKKTIFEKRMGNIDDAVPFFGEGFNNIYPLIMVVYTFLVASNFFDRVVGFFGNWKRLRLQTEADDMDGFDPSGLIILQKERTWLEQGRQAGEQVIPLARNFNGADIESGNNITDRTVVEMKATTTDGVKGSPSRPLKEEARKYGTSREAISSKYAAIREQSRQVSNPKPVENNITSAKVSLLEAGNSRSGNQKGDSSSGLASTWRSMKFGFQNFKANIEAKKFLPLRQNQETKLVSRVNSSDSESLDEIFQRLKRPSIDHSDEDENGNEPDIKITGPSR